MRPSPCWSKKTTRWSRRCLNSLMKTHSWKRTKIITTQGLISRISWAPQWLGWMKTIGLLAVWAMINIKSKRQNPRLLKMRSSRLKLMMLWKESKDNLCRTFSKGRNRISGRSKMSPKKHLLKVKRPWGNLRTYKNNMAKTTKNQLSSLIYKTLISNDLWYLFIFHWLILFYYKQTKTKLLQILYLQTGFQIKVSSVKWV